LRLKLVSRGGRQNRAAFGAGLRVGTGGGFAGSMSFRRQALHARLVAAGTAILFHSGIVAAGVYNGRSRAPVMPQRAFVVRGISIAAAGTGGWNLL